MARVIKGNAGQKQPRRQVAKLRPTGDKKVIGKDVYRAQQEGSEILAKAEEQKAAILAEAKQKAAQAREEAQAEGAQEAFETAAAEALEAFRRRALRYGEAADDIQVLALEVSQKILGTSLKLDEGAIDAVLAEGMDQLRGRRKLRIQVPPERQQALLKERPRLMATLEQEPDLVVEAIGDVSAGRARIVTEPGGALCSEQAALDFVTEALGIDEQAVAPAPQSAVIDMPPDEQEALRETFDNNDDSGAVWDGLASEEEEEQTDFLPARSRSRDASGTEQVDRDDVQRARDIHRIATDRTPVDAEEQERQRRRARRRKKAREAEKAKAKQKAAPSDVDRTMALDVSELRDELADLPSDELDLFADDAVLD